MKFGPFIWYFKRKLFKSFYKSWDLKNSSRSFWVCKAQPLLENEISETTYLIRNGKTIKISPKQPTDLLRFLFTEDSLKIKKVRNSFPRCISHIVFWQKFSFVILQNWPNFITRLCYFPIYSVKCVSCFICLVIWWRHDIRMS